MHEVFKKSMGLVHVLQKRSCGCGYRLQPSSMLLSACTALGRLTETALQELPQKICLLYLNDISNAI